jgi:hypothetical protein
VTITNTYENKTRDKLAAISSNIIAVPPTIEGLTAGITEAVQRVPNLDARLAGSHVDWAANWDEAFNPGFMEKLKQFIEKT